MSQDFFFQRTFSSELNSGFCFQKSRELPRKKNQRWQLRALRVCAKKRSGINKSATNAVLFSRRASSRPGSASKSAPFIAGPSRPFVARANGTCASSAKSKVGRSKDSEVGPLKHVRTKRLAKSSADGVFKPKATNNKKRPFFHTFEALLVVKSLG